MGWGRSGVKDRVGKIGGGCRTAEENGKVRVLDPWGIVYEGPTWNDVGRHMDLVRATAHQRRAERTKGAKGRTVAR
jgi:hypothetical protein